MSIFGLIGAGIGALGSIFGANKAANSANKGAKLAHRDTRWAGKMNLKWQKAFARKGIQWRVKDARKAGIHPLAALGATGANFAPSFQAGNAGEIIADGGAAAGQMYAQAGQDIGRGLAAMGDVDSKLAALQVRAAELQVKNMELQNVGLASRLALQTQAGSPPSYPSSPSRYLLPGQGETVTGIDRSALANGTIQEMPLQRTVEGAPGTEPGAVPELGFTKNPDGSYSPVMSNDAKQRLEEDTFGTMQWNLRDRILGPLFDPGKYMPPEWRNRKDGFAVYNPLMGKWEWFHQKEYKAPNGGSGW